MSQTAALTLTGFLTARLDEDEVIARAASPGPWHVNAEHDAVFAIDDIEVCDGFALSGPQLRNTTDHIARWDPARVLAEVAAKRRIVQEAAWEFDRGPASPRARLLAHVTLCLLAKPHAEHEDWRDEWRIH